ncbi:MAG: OmpW family outer membrane protein [Motiliproteus sp.]
MLQQMLKSRFFSHSEQRLLWWCAALLLVSNLPAIAFAGDGSPFSLRAGWIRIDADSVKGSVALNGSEVPGATLTLDDVDQGGLFLSWELTPTLAVETLVSTPIKIDINAGGGLLGSRYKAAEAKVLPLTLLGRYTPTWQWHGLRPFVGAGAAYIYFDGAKTTAAFDLQAAGLGAFNPRVETDNHWRAILEVGADWNFSPRSFLNVTWLYFQGETPINVLFDGGVTLHSQVSYAPSFYALTVGHRF